MNALGYIKSAVKFLGRLISECFKTVFIPTFSLIPNEFCEMMPDNVAAIKGFCLKCSKIAEKICGKQQKTKEKPRE